MRVNLNELSLEPRPRELRKLRSARERLAQVCYPDGAKMFRPVRAHTAYIAAIYPIPDPGCRARVISRYR